MKRKIKLIKKVKYKKPYLLVVIFLIIAIFLSFKLINNKITPVLMEYASAKAKTFATALINQSIEKYTKDFDSEELFIVSKNDEDEIKSIDFNPINVNKILNLITNDITNNLSKIEQGTSIIENYGSVKEGIIYRIPLGMMFKNSLLNNLGPKIPVRLNFIGDITSNINTNITDYGINNALIEVYIHITVQEKVILPFASNNIKVENKVPVALKLIQGKIPNYYFKGMSGDSKILTVPVE